MNILEVLQLLEHGNQLKRTIRTGWAQRGITAPEDVAAHSYGVVFTTLVLSHYVEAGAALDRERALIMAALHDLPEGLTTDIPSPAWRFLPEGVKTAVERQAMLEILEGAPQSGELLSYWEEMQANETPAARLVHDADKLDMYLQASVYERQTGNSELAEFWRGTPYFHYPEAQLLYDELRNLREGE